MVLVSMGLVSRKFSVVFWDMDGIFVDIEFYWMVVEMVLVELFGGLWSYVDVL